MPKGSTPKDLVMQAEENIVQLANELDHVKRSADAVDRSLDALDEVKKEITEDARSMRDVNDSLSVLLKGAGKDIDKLSATSLKSIKAASEAYVEASASLDRKLDKVQQLIEGFEEIDRTMQGMFQQSYDSQQNIREQMVNELKERNIELTSQIQQLSANVTALNTALADNESMTRKMIFESSSPTRGKLRTVMFLAMANAVLNIFILLWILIK